MKVKYRIIARQVGDRAECIIRLLDGSNLPFTTAANLFPDIKDKWRDLDAIFIVKDGLAVLQGDKTIYTWARQIVPEEPHQNDPTI